MASSATVTLHQNEAGRPNGKSGRPTSILIFNGNDDLTQNPTQMQFLAARNIAEARLGLLASLIWEGPRG